MSELLSKEKIDELLDILRIRFEENIDRHKNIKWSQVLEKLQYDQTKLRSLFKMEITGGEPDIVVFDKESNHYIFIDCSIETPLGRRSLCYDREALNSRKKNKPKNNVCDVIDEMGLELLTEEEYKMLQKLGEFDLKTSSWIFTPVEIRKLGGALFCDRRYNEVFVYHNSAESYYSSRGFRGKLKI